MTSPIPVVAKHREHLEQLINRTVNKQGPNCDLNFIDVSRITDMSRLFYKSPFDGDISTWNVCDECDLRAIFRGSQFEKAGKDKPWLDRIYRGRIDRSKNSDGVMVAKNRAHLKALIDSMVWLEGEKCDLNCIDISRVTNMNYLFEFSPFNGDISKWDVSHVTEMDYMFADSCFNGDIGNWDVSNVRKMGRMFIRSNFAGNIDQWNVSDEADLFEIFRQSMLEKMGKLPKWFNGSVYGNPPGVVCSWP